MLIDKLITITIKSDNGTNMPRAINNRSYNASQDFKCYAIRQKRNIALSLKVVPP
jgi:hypothetical protein